MLDSSASKLQLDVSNDEAVPDFPYTRCCSCCSLYHCCCFQFECFGNFGHFSCFINILIFHDHTLANGNKLFLLDLSCSFIFCSWHQQQKVSAFFFVHRPLMTLTMEILRLLVRTSPIDDADNPVFDVLHVDICSIRNLYCFWFNPFLIKSLFLLNNDRNRYSAANPFDKMKSHVGKQLYQLVIVTIPCNIQY